MLPIDCIRLYDIVKATKCDICHIYTNVIIGTDKSNTTLTEVFYDTKVPQQYEIEKDSLKIVSDLCQDIKNNDINVDYISQYATRYYKSSELENIYNSTIIALNNRIVPNLKIESLKSDDIFMNIISNKSADGASRYIVHNKYILTIYSGLLPINKSDKVGLEIYEIDNFSYIAKFIINKGKFTLNKYIRYFYL